MTKKDYELIARAFKESKRIVGLPNLDKDTLEKVRAGIGQAQLTLSQALEEKNPRFDAVKFSSACEYFD